ncbi:hypothetical protein Hypma_011079 [Hypsizygus marmoreus]|uniref:Uncharacterized protein n=1 Tax=Hypsizygus marmoreus TaxID=39966 RepID=A0A369JN60_HYPMA|nr:hypothetical protein Hypma_011079 [Hypsizygus marmoreus]
METNPGHASNILHLPNELLSLIFISSLPAGSPTFSNDVLSLPLGMIPPARTTAIAQTLRLATVCRAFHACAWDTPQLWCRIAITLGIGRKFALEQKEEERGGIEGRVGTLHRWLERSGSCQLSVRVQWGGRRSGHGQDMNEAETEAAAAVGAIAKHAARWRDVCLVLPVACFLQLQAEGYPNAKNLEHLTLLRDPYTAFGEDEEGSTITAFRHVHALREVTLLGVPVKMLDVRWDCLARFTGYFFRDDGIVDVLRHAPGLKECVFAWCLGNTTAGSLPIVPLKHDGLQVLRIAGNAGVLRHLTLPALKELELRMGKEVWGWSPQALISLLARSHLGSTLKVLRLTVGFVSEGRLVECLEALPGLRVFRLENLNDRVHSAFSDGVLRRLAVREEGKGRSVIVPRLESLEVVGCSCQFDIEVLGEMLESRRKGISDSRLKRFGLEGSQDSPLGFDDAILSSLWMETLISKGMVTDIRRRVADL